MPRLCPHHDRCGGCATPETPYEEQIALKTAKMRELFDRDIPVEPSEQIHHYRNTMHFVCAFDKIGLRAPKVWHDVIDVTECLLLSERADQVRNTVREWVQELGLPIYDLRSHEGFLRYLVFREAKFTGEWMLNLVTAGTEHEQLQPLLDRIAEEFAPTALLCSERQSRGDDAKGEPYRVIGKDHIVETFDEIEYVIKPSTFFQTNPYQARVAYRAIREAIPQGSRTLDLFCGAGTIGIFCADRASEVIGVELIPENVETAQENIARNGCTNVRIVQEKAKNFFKVETEFDVIITDPPRSGMGKKEVKRIRESAPKRIIYMSCNPETQKTDLVGIMDDNMYSISSFRAFDFFPHTPHIESLAVLDRN